MFRLCSGVDLPDPNDVGTAVRKGRATRELARRPDGSLDSPIRRSWDTWGEMFELVNVNYFTVGDVYLEPKPSQRLASNGNAMLLVLACCSATNHCCPDDQSERWFAQVHVAR